MKTFARTVFVVTCLASLSNYAATTYTETVDGVTWTYTVANGCASIGGGASSSPAVPTSTTGAITIPSTLGGYSVTSIGNYAFHNCSGLTSVAIPNSVTNIGEEAFEGCCAITNVSLPASAIYGTKGIAPQKISRPITIVGSAQGISSSGSTPEWPEGYCELSWQKAGSFVVYVELFGLQDITFDWKFSDSQGFINWALDGQTKAQINSMTTSDYWWHNVYGIWFTQQSDIQLGKHNVQILSTGAAAVKMKLKNMASIFSSSYDKIISITLTDNACELPYQAFAGCASLRSVCIPNTVTNIGDRAFRDCRALTSIAIPNGVTDIGNGLFEGCCGLSDVSLPDGVVQIGDKAFIGCSNLTAITLPSHIERIGDRAFSDCVSLNDIEIPGGVTNIGTATFNGCSGLQSISVAMDNSCYMDNSGLLLTKDGRTLVQGVNGNVQIPESVTNIMPYAFSGCSNLKRVVIPNSVIRIAESAFKGCSGLEAVTIPQYVCSYPQSFKDYFSTEKQLNVSIADGATRIDDYVFKDCAFAALSIPNSVTNIDPFAFYNTFSVESVAVPQSGCLGVFRGVSSITNIVINEGVTNIGTRAFANCSRLLNVSLPDSVEHIAHDAFAACSELTSLTIPQRMCTCGLSEVFPTCDSIVNVIIRDGVTRINNFVFEGCVELKNVTIPNSVVSIGQNAFYGCSDSLFDTTSIPGVKLVDGWVIGTTGTIPAILELTGIRGVAERAFANCLGLMKVIIPDGVRSIGDYAFLDCADLASVAIPSSVTNIGAAAFQNCHRITDVTIPQCVCTDKLSSIFPSYNSITNVVICDGVTSMGNNLFSGCSGLTNVTIPDSVTSIGTSAFRGCAGLADSDGFVIVRNVLYDYVGSATDVTIPDDVTSIGDSVFYNRQTLTGIALPDGLTRIGSSAFYGCAGLMNMTMPDSVTSIGVSAFQGCRNITSVTVPQYVCTNRLSDIFQWYSALTNVVIREGVSNIGDYMFLNCKGVKSVTIPDSVTNIGASAFQNCTSLASITIPDNVTSIGNNALRGCTALKTVTIPNEVQNIGIGLFYNDTALTNVLMHSSITNIGSSAFYGCTALSNITIPEMAEKIGASAFYNCKSLTDVIFEGDAPTSVGNNAFWGISQDCHGWVRRASTGWGIALPGRWNNILLDYIHYIVTLNANGGTCETESLSVAEGAAIGDLPVPMKMNYEFVGWFTVPEGGSRVLSSTKISHETTLYAHWESTSLTYEDALDVGEGVVIATDATIPWRPIRDVGARVGDSSARSGSVGDRESTWLSATVEGAGTMSFWCKVSCEHDEDGTFTWDRLMVYTNDIEIVEWRMDGETDWTERTLSFNGGANTVKWVYYKDRTGAAGEDCAWIDGVVWTPSGSIPVIAEDAAAEVVTNAIESAGFADEAGVKAAIGGSATEYGKFKEWAQGVKVPVGGNGGGAVATQAGEAAVVANTNAAAAYLLGAERLFENKPKVEFGEVVVVESGTQGTGGTGTAISVAVTVKDGEEAVKCAAEKVKEMFEATSDLGDWAEGGGAAVSSKPPYQNALSVEVEVKEPVAGDSAETMRFKVTPGDGTATRAFLRIRR